MDWRVRKVRDPGGELDIRSIYRQISSMTCRDLDVLMPYTTSLVTLRGYKDQFLVAEDPETFGRLETEGIPPILGGAVHFVPNDDDDYNRCLCFLEYVKQVPADILDEFMQYSPNHKFAMIGQVICPGKGSFYAILEEAKKQFEEIWCWMSIYGPSYKSYQRYGFVLNMDDVREFWNVYKCGYSKFVLGKWKAD